MKTKMYQEEEFLHPETEVDLETRTYFSDREYPTIVLSVGLGGSAGQDSSVYNLTSRLVNSGYQVKVFSPRNSGRSTGHLTIDNYIFDNELVLEDTAQKNGELAYAMGHSLGGYSLARILDKGSLAKRAVLLAPLVDIKEQNPEIFKLLKNKNMKRMAAHMLELIGLDSQRFSHVEDAQTFLDSLEKASPCNSQLSVPTYILLVGKSNTGFEIKNLDQLRQHWERLQTKESEIEIYPELDHYFAEQNLPNRKNFFRNSRHTRKILDHIDNFLRQVI